MLTFTEMLQQNWERKSYESNNASTSTIQWKKIPKYSREVKY